MCPTHGGNQGKSGIPTWKGLPCTAHYQCPLLLGFSRSNADDSSQPLPGTCLGNTGQQRRRIFLAMELEKQVLKESFKLKTGSSQDSVKAVCSHCHGASCSQHVTPISGDTPYSVFSPHLPIWTQGRFQLPPPGFLIGWFCFRCWKYSA